MSAKAAALVRTWAVGKYTVTLTVPRLRRGGVQSAVFEWAPEQPSQLTGAEAEQYRAGRDEAFRSLGLNVLILEA